MGVVVAVTAAMFAMTPPAQAQFEAKLASYVAATARDDLTDATAAWCQAIRTGNGAQLKSAQKQIDEAAKRYAAATGKAPPRPSCGDAHVAEKITD